MNTSIGYPVPQRDVSIKLIHKAAAALLGGFVIFLFLTLTAVFTLQIAYMGKINPGVSVSGVDIGGLTRAEASDLIMARLTYPQEGLIALEGEGQVWTYAPIDLGLILDYGGTAEAAYKLGRQGWPWQRLAERITLMRSGVEISPIMILDERITRARLDEIASQINVPMKEAALRLEGAQVIAEPGQVGRILDAETTLAKLRQPMTNLVDTSQELVIQEFHPAILDVSSQADTASKILSQPLTLQVSDSENEKLGPWEISPETLAGMLIIERTSQDGVDSYQFHLDENTLYNFLYPLTPSLKQTPQNARFIFNDETRELELVRAATIGRELMVEETIQQINEKIQNGEHSVNLVFDFINPEVTDNAKAADLGITEVVSQQSSFFYGSDESRIQNIQTAAAQFHGILIAPGETFSMVDNIGDISLDSGYAEAWIIYGDRTIKGVGGGVCQVSTTLFRTVFFGGYPVVERWPHSYRVYYYELTQSGAVNEDLAGLDATVYAPVVDFKFTNDTPYWLLMETYVDAPARRITWKFYSTDDGREVDWSTTGLTNTEKPPYPEYEKNPDLKEGQIKQVDWAVDGATVTVFRTVTRNGEVIYDDTFHTVYTPWSAVCQYGPGTDDYPPTGDKRDRYSCKIKGN